MPNDNTVNSCTNGLSIVVTGRNDNYDGNFDDRLIRALSRNILYLPDAEFIYVEWNPISDKTPLANKIKSLLPKVKCYVVHPKFNKTYCTIDEFLEYPAKNVGIRKACKDYILCTNSDVIISPQVANSMRFSKLDKNVVYRATRVDISIDNLDVVFPIPEKDILGLNEPAGNTPLSLPTNASGDFTMVHKDAWNRITGYCEEFPGQRIYKDGLAIYLLMKNNGMSWKNLGQISHWRHASSWSSLYHKRAKVGDIHWNYMKTDFTRNKDSWGLIEAVEEERDGVIWLT